MHSDNEMNTNYDDSLGFDSSNNIMKARNKNGILVR